VNNGSETTLIIEVPKALAAPTAAVPGGQLVVKARTIFREQAVQSYLASMRESEVLRVSPPWARWILVTAGITLAALLASSFVVRVDQTGRARGALRVADGVQGIACQTNGVVVEIGARSGDVVEQGALLARIDSTATKTALLEAERQIQRAQADVDGFLARRDKEQAERIALLRDRSGLLSRRLQNQRATTARLKLRMASIDRLVEQGLAPALDKGVAENDFAAAQREELDIEQQIGATQLQISNIGAELAQELERRKGEVTKATDRRDALTFQLAQTEVRAPKAGRLEALAVKSGDSVNVGAPIARLIPQGAPRSIVVFLPEADRAFLREGSSEVRIELDQLPVGEFGSLHAKVVRIASDLATPAEVADVGLTTVSGPSYRVELALEDADAARLDKLLRPGSLVTARFVLRTRRLATVIFEPLKRIFDQ